MYKLCIVALAALLKGFVVTFSFCVAGNTVYNYLTTYLPNKNNLFLCNITITEHIHYQMFTTPWSKTEGFSSWQKGIWLSTLISHQPFQSQETVLECLLDNWMLVCKNARYSCCHVSSCISCHFSTLLQLHLFYI